MSYILDALRKSERQRQVGEVPRVHTVQESYSAEPARRNPWILVAVLAILANIGVGGWLWWQHQQSTDGVAPDTSNTPVSAQQPSAASSAPAAAPNPSPALSPPPATQPVLAPRRASPPATTSLPAAAAPELDEIVVFESLEQPSAPPAPAADRYPDLVDISQLSGPLHLAMLALELNVHVYDPSPSQRFVLINMKRYAEGHALPQGPVIEEITPDGVVLAYQGQRFLLPRD